MRKYLILLALIFSFFSFSNIGYNDYVGYWVGSVENEKPDFEIVKENNEYYLVEYAFVRGRLEKIADKYLLAKVKDGLENKVGTEVYSFENARSEIQKKYVDIKVGEKVLAQIFDGKKNNPEYAFYYKKMDEKKRQNFEREKTKARIKYELHTF